MRFDDRLLTVLNQPADDRHDAAVRWRQLVDLVARGGQNGGSSVLGVALDAIRTEAHQVDEAVRAAAARAVAAFPLPLGLLEYFAADRLSVSAPVLAAATLDHGQWSAVLTVADDETRAFIRALHPELTQDRGFQVGHPTLGLPSNSAERTGRNEPFAEAAEYAPPSLHEVVERIERRRRIRAEQAAAPAPIPGPSDERPPLFRWECGPSGEIAWVEGAPRGSLIGRSLAKPQDHDRERLDPEVVRAFSLRAPFRDRLLSVAGGGPLSGEWKISGVPAFYPADGRFAGYRGVALREEPAPRSESTVFPEILADPASLRELMHEIRTPLNAVIGFAEIIEGQYLGPADEGYRERAGEIVRHARKLLTAIDDLDFAAKIHSAPGAARERVDLSMLVGRASGELQDLADKARIAVDVTPARSEVAAAVQPELADRLLVRLFGAVAEAATPGDRLRLSIEATEGDARIAITSQSGRPVTQTPGVEPNSEALDGFSLKLARGLARISGGDLLTGRDSVALVFPRA